MCSASKVNPFSAFRVGLSAYPTFADPHVRNVIINTTMRQLLIDRDLLGPVTMLTFLDCFTVFPGGRGTRPVTTAWISECWDTCLRKGNGGPTDHTWLAVMTKLENGKDRGESHLQTE